MIARFIYTDCESKGPFSSGVGKKFKSVVFPGAWPRLEALDDLKERLPRNSLSEGYQLPNVPNAMTTAEFEALPKSWAFAQITNDTFALERITTSGQCYGRNNRFDEGFVFSINAWSDLVSRYAEDTKPLQLRPVDFVHSTGWLNPRGEAELESAELDEGFYEFAPSFREQLKDDLGTVRGLDGLRPLLKSFATAQIERSAVHVSKADADQFFAIIAILTRLTAPVYAWQIGFSDVWEQPRSRDLADGSNPQFVLGDEATKSTALADLWAELALEVFTQGFPGKVMAKIDDVAQGLQLQRNNFAQGLALLPIAIIELGKEGTGNSQLSQRAKDFLQSLNQPEIGYVS